MEIISFGISIVSFGISFGKLVGRQSSYMFYLGSNVNNLKSQIRDLEATKVTLQHELDEATRKGEEINEIVKNWLTDAGNISETVDRFLNDNKDQLVRIRCSSTNYLFPNLVLRHRLSKKAKKMAQSVAEIIVAHKFDSISYVPILQHNFRSKDYMAFCTRNSIMTGILEALRKDDITSVGVYGMPGIGKTTLVKEVARQALEEKLFDDAIEVTVSESPNLEKVQQDIAKGLHLVFQDEDGVKERSDRLRHRLGKEEKLLLILDDVWKKLDLHALGIDFDQDHQKGCKILLTSRNQDVLQGDMDVNVENNFKVEPLSESEAWIYFAKIVGDDFSSDDENSELKSTAIQIVEQCACLPLAIVTVAHALKNKGLHAWNDALRRLQNSTMSKKVYSSVRLSYDFLKDEENDEEDGDQSQKIFLLCCLYEEDANMSIQDLLNLVTGWGLFRNVYTLEAARDRLQTLLDKLKAHGLLSNGTDVDSVKMHDIIRDVGISIASADPYNMYNIRGNDELKECLENDKLKDALAISLGANYEDESLPSRLKCSNLHLLWMIDFDEVGRADRTVELFTSIKFEKLQEARGSRILKLKFQCSINSLLGERGFKMLLKRSENLYIDGIKGLKNLVYELNRDAGLPHLKNLKVNNVETQYVIKSAVEHYLSDDHNILPSLETFSFKQMVESCNAMEEVVTLLERQGAVNSESAVNQCIEFPKLKEMKLSNLPKLIGFWSECDIRSCTPNQGQNTEEEPFSTTDSASTLFNQKVAFPYLESLELRKDETDMVGHETFRNIIISLVQLEVLDVSRCKDMEEIVVVNSDDELAAQLDQRIEFPKLNNLKLGDLQHEFIKFSSESNQDEGSSSDSATSFLIRRVLISQVAFPSLETLDLWSVECIRIWRVQLSAEKSYSFQNLTTLEISWCNRLKIALSFAIAKSLVQLQTLSADDHLEISSLNDQHLPSFYITKLEVTGVRSENLLSASVAAAFVHLEILKVYKCGLMKEVSFSNLKSLNLWGCKSINKIWGHGKYRTGGLGCDDHLSSSVILTIGELPNLNLLMDFKKLTSLESKKSVSSWVCFQALTVLRVEKCVGIKYLFTPFIAKNLRLLKVMVISECQSMREIIATDDDDDDEELQQGLSSASSSSSLNNNIVFHQLEFLVLNYLPCLTSFHSGNCALEFPKLSSLVVGNCPKMSNFCDHVTVTAPELHTFMSKYYVGWRVKAELNSNDDVQVDYKVFKKDDMVIEEFVKESGDKYININTTIRHLWEKFQNQVY
ncbi:hypothetical protein FNV43_RR00732 [Rhamnella rubrinervis]|uniref:AAA+ ATPase domain-containing protein n=1 Tax=Rhamnella rubrinervis TaxID=2594499 RepID=A0A8K0HR91_9ROSA|nr:hypothetical protein FNV43_RR00732 [Rhamnella rubrinervis]